MSNLRIQKLVSSLIVIVGLCLTVALMIVEGEPTAVPLGLILIGATWHFITRKRMSS